MFILLRAYEEFHVDVLSGFGLGQPMKTLRLARRNYLKSTFGALLLSGCREGIVIVNQILVEILVGLPVLGSSNLKEVFLQMSVCMQ